MGVLNVTPDSFHDGGRYSSDAALLTQAEKMLREGATFIDVGGYSTRPGAAEISVDEELNRAVPAVTSIIKQFPEAIISIDTFRAGVAKAAVDAGASMVNDISGGNLDSAMFKTIASLQVPYILMHMRGNPGNMTRQTDYQNLIKELCDYFHQKIHELLLLGVKDIIVDPGFGFAKTREQNFELLRHLNALHIVGKPILVGLSRKSMIWKTLNITPDDALNGATSLNTIALLKGASILRVHDVREAMEVVRLFSSLNKDIRTS